ncbi:MAG: twin-arginine translocase subunit TatB [Gemmatimonadetes bacterium]|nr:twin-arginine translocase subunit TatB [Gemmatimonadota bacterium]
MGIGDIGWSEFLFIAVLALLLLGPRRLPEVANAIGRSLREFRRALNEVQDEFRRELEIRAPGLRPWELGSEASRTPPAGDTAAPEGETRKAAPAPPGAPASTPPADHA